MLMHASKVISNFKNALENTRSNGVISDTNITDCIESKSFRHDQIEEHLPHSMVWVVKLGCHMLAARWEGQFIVGVNPGPEDSVI
ncbi:hypothetical protein DPMN_088452 [Dreissena polymorpha]|uniref:Uncharacterized protein n=1 Tax=Dreissena polymorpha TaxID=45954 RepID=A0A9D4KU45_DREPO|nr:hypothetical protein DPMN_088452 [Dreissena polymorpha]